MRPGVSLCGRDVVGQRGLVARDPLAADHADLPADGVGHHAGVDGRHAQRGRLRDERRKDVRRSEVRALPVSDSCSVMSSQVKEPHI